MKLALDISSVEATKPLTSTCAPLPKSTPLGLTKNTRPFAVKLPKMYEGSALNTRFNAALCELGCEKLTPAFCPILNDCQLTIIFCEFCVTCILLAEELIAPAPPTTTPFCGSVDGSIANAGKPITINSLPSHTGRRGERRRV